MRRLKHLITCALAALVAAQSPSLAADLNITLPGWGANFSDGANIAVRGNVLAARTRTMLPEQPPGPWVEIVSSVSIELDFTAGGLVYIMDSKNANYSFVGDTPDAKFDGALTARQAGGFVDLYFVQAQGFSPLNQPVAGCNDMVMIFIVDTE